MFRCMVVAGVGLIGGSLALAVRRHRLAEEIVGFGRAGTNLRFAQRKGMIDRVVVDPSKIPGETDLLMLATPVQATAPLSRAFSAALRPGCVVSDVGSVKAEVVREVERWLPSNVPFVGAHPIAGGEQWGAQAARADLFRGRRCILTPTNRTKSAALKKIGSLWRRVGAEVEVMDPEIHDRILGMVSHLPHVLAFTMVNILGRTRLDGVDVKSYCGTGFKDFTRIASSRPEIWRDICVLNRRAVGRSLAEYIRDLERLKRWILQGKGDLLEGEFARANEIRERIP